jgi:hypothetical protein
MSERTDAMTPEMLEELIATRFLEEFIESGKTFCWGFTESSES